MAIAADLHGEDVARSIQLAIEYDPAPPFASGSPANADPALVERTRAMAAARQDERREAVEQAAMKISGL